VRASAAVREIRHIVILLKAILDSGIWS